MRAALIRLLKRYGRFIPMTLVLLSTGTCPEVQRARAAPSKARPVAHRTITPHNATQVAAQPTEFERLNALEFVTLNSTRKLKAQLYDARGYIQPTTAAQLDELLCDTRDKDHPQSTTMSRRTLQLVFRAAYHFSAFQVQVVSGYRAPGKHREGMHATGQAIDFRLIGVDATRLASYLRTLARVGVGVYTHPKTHFVHLDVRERSFHWLDASPPHRHWRERNITTKHVLEADAQYSVKDDWPEGVHAPGEAL